MTTRCDWCPVAAGPCWSRARHPRGCTLAHPDHPDADYWRGKVAERSVGLPADAPDLTAPAPVPPPMPPFPRRRDGRSRIRVGFVSAGLCVGGAERHMLCVASFLDPARFDFAGIAIREGGIVQGPMAAEWRALGVPWAFGPDAIRAVYRDCDIAYVWGVPAAEQLLADRPASCKVVLVSHGICGWTREAMGDARLADEVVITAKASLDTIPESERHRVRLIYNGIDPARVVPRLTRSEQREAWGIADPAARLVGNVARISGEKGCHLAAPMIAELRRRGSPEWRFVWVGPGWETEAVRERAEALAPGGLVLPGHADDVGSAHHALDWYVAPTIDDAHPLSLVEAMLAGTPIISAAVGYAAEHPELFRLVPRGPGGGHLADALAADLADPAGTAARAAAARAYATEHLTPGPFAARWDALLSSLGRKARRAAKPRVPLGTPRPQPGGT